MSSPEYIIIFFHSAYGHQISNYPSLPNNHPSKPNNLEYFYGDTRLDTKHELQYFFDRI